MMMLQPFPVIWHATCEARACHDFSILGVRVAAVRFPASVPQGP